MNLPPKIIAMTRRLSLIAIPMALVWDQSLAAQSDPARSDSIDDAQVQSQLEQIEAVLATLREGEAQLGALRRDLVECEAGCMTPSEAVIAAFSEQENARIKRRVLLDINSGGQSLFGNLDQLFFVNSRPDYAELGTLTVAFAQDVLNDLLRRARVCGGGLDDQGRIAVEGCRQKGISDTNMFTMMQRLYKRRILVEGHVRLQWIDSRSGIRLRETSPAASGQGAATGYYQPWVWVTDADQISFVYED